MPPRNPSVKLVTTVRTVSGASPVAERTNSTAQSPGRCLPGTPSRTRRCGRRCAMRWTPRPPKGETRRRRHRRRRRGRAHARSSKGATLRSEQTRLPGLAQIRIHEGLAGKCANRELRFASGRVGRLEVVSPSQAAWRAKRGANADDDLLRREALPLVAESGGAAPPISPSMASGTRSEVDRQDSRRTQTSVPNVFTSKVW